MDSGQLDSSIFVDEKPSQKQSDSIFLDYNPADLRRMETASIFRDSPSSPPSNKLKSQYAPEKTAEEIKAMSIPERIAYSKQLEQEFKFRESKGITKGTLSGASFGASEYVPGLEPEEDDFLFGVGEVIGSSYPVAKLYGVIGKPLVKLAVKSPYAKTALTSLARMTGFGATGVTYETTKDLVKGEIPTVDELVKTGATWIAIDAALQATGAGIAFGQAVRNIAKAEGVPAKEILSRLWNSTKNFSKQKFIAPENIHEPEVEVLMAEAEKAEAKIAAKEIPYADKKQITLKENAKEAPVEAQEQTPMESLSKKLDVSPEAKGLEKTKPKTEVGTLVEQLGETRNKGEFYHGSPTEFERPTSEHYSSLNYYGQGFYTTDAADIAAGYANRKFKGDKNPSIYKVFEHAKPNKPNLVNMETRFEDLDQKVKDKLKDLEKHDELIELALSEKPENLREFYDLIRDIGTGEGFSADTIQETFEVLRENFSKLGYNGLKHKGGLRTGKKPHEVRIYFEPEQSLKVEKLKPKKIEVKPAKLEIQKPKEPKKEEIPPKQEKKSPDNGNGPPKKPPNEPPKGPTGSEPAGFGKELPEPIIETTGQGAAKRHEYAKTFTENVISKVKDFIEAAKTPGQSLKRLSESMNTAVFNFLAPLEKLEKDIPIAERVTSKIKLSQSVASEINSVLDNGIFSNITGNFEHGGLKAAYGDLTWTKITKGLKPEQYSLPELDAYRTSKIALKRQSEGKKTGVDTAIAKQDVARLQSKYEPIDKRIREFQQATITHYGKDLLGKDLIKKFNENYYSPLYRVMDSGKDSILKTGSLAPKKPFFKFEGSTRKIVPPSESDPFNASMLISNARKNDSVLAYLEKVQKGELPGKIRKGKQSPIPEGIKKSLEIDPELEALAETLYNQTRREGFTPEENVIRCWKDGNAIDIEVPEDIYKVFKTAGPEQMGTLAKALSAINRLFSKGISLEPRKFLSIYARDALSSLIYSRTGSNPISIVEALADIQGDTEIYKQFKAMGGDIYASRLATRIDRAYKVDDLITPGKEGILVPFEKMFSFFKKYSDKLNEISMSIPLAEYKRALAFYGDTPEGRIVAAMEARRVTYDPTRKGASKLVRGIGNFTPFWNVSLQDMAMLPQNLKNKETWIKGFLAITLPTLALMFYNDGNPDYDSLTPVDKAAFWHMYTPMGHIRVPIPWLLGTVFKVQAEFFYNIVKNLKEQGNQRGKEAWQGLYENFIGNVSGSLPPILQNYIELSTGKSPASPVGLLLGVESKAPDVIPRRLQDFPPELQYTSKTSQLAKWFGEKWGVSPIKIERSFKTYTGLLGADALALADEIAYQSGLSTDKRPEQREKNYLLLGNFVSENTPTRTKYQTQFYEFLSEKTRQTKARTVIPEYGDAALDEVDLFAWNREISSAFKEIRRIEEDPDISSKDKKLQIEEQQKEINSKYKEAVEEVLKERSKKTK